MSDKPDWNVEIPRMLRELARDWRFDGLKSSRDMRLNVEDRIAKLEFEEAETGEDRSELKAKLQESLDRLDSRKDKRVEMYDTTYREIIAFIDRAEKALAEASA